MPTNARFEFNERGFRGVLVSAEMQQAVLAKAQEVKKRAEQIAPVRTGRYSGENHDIEPAGFEASVAIKDGRAVGRVDNNVPYARFLERGTEHMKAQRPLGKALDSIKE